MIVGAWALWGAGIAFRLFPATTTTVEIPLLGKHNTVLEIHVDDLPARPPPPRRPCGEADFIVVSVWEEGSTQSVSTLFEHEALREETLLLPLPSLSAAALNLRFVNPFPVAFEVVAEVMDFVEIEESFNATVVLGGAPLLLQTLSKALRLAVASCDLVYVAVESAAILDSALVPLAPFNRWLDLPPDSELSLRAQTPVRARLSAQTWEAGRLFRFFNAGQVRIDSLRLEFAGGGVFNASGVLLPETVTYRVFTGPSARAVKAAADCGWISPKVTVREVSPRTLNNLPVVTPGALLVQARSSLGSFNLPGSQLFSNKDAGESEESWGFKLGAAVLMGMISLASFASLVTFFSLRSTATG